MMPRAVYRVLDFTRLGVSVGLKTCPATKNIQVMAESETDTEEEVKGTASV